MSDDERVLQSLLAIARQVGERALSLGASAAGFLAWAIVPGYLYYAAYLWAMGAHWALSQVSIVSIAGAGGCIVFFVGANVVAALSIRLLLKHSEVWWTVLSSASLPLSIVLLAGSIWDVSWLKGPAAMDLFALSIVAATTVVIARVVYTAAIRESLTLQQKVIALMALPFMSALFAVLGGLLTASADLRAAGQMRKVALLAHTDHPQDWRLVLPLGDHLLLTSLDSGRRVYRVIASTDAAGVGEAVAPAPSKGE
jgi:hypothetical protein